MSISGTRNRGLALALSLPFVTTLSLMYFATRDVNTSTYLAAFGLAIGTTLVAVNTWRNAQAVPSLRQANFAANADAVLPAGDRARHQWVSRSDVSAAEGRMLALLALSVAVSGVIALTWLR